jgi:hypothetical protein
MAGLLRATPKDSLHGFANFISSIIQSAWLSEAGVPIETIGHDDDMLVVSRPRLDLVEISLVRASIA